ncbi:MAG: hypothetical protein JWO33_1836, partial [Caulobacteraceae bacterium]|nr:hypothetical protein [Caulobacteraceae bacterium]
MKLRLLAGAATVAVMAASGASAAENGWYGAIDIGWHTQDNWEATNTFTAAPSGPLAYTAWTDDDLAIFSRLGYRVAPHWRVEGELGFRSSDITAFQTDGVFPGYGITQFNVGTTSVGTATAIAAALVTVGTVGTTLPAIPYTVFNVQGGGGINTPFAICGFDTVGNPPGNGIGPNSTQCNAPDGDFRHTTGIINVIYDFAPDAVINPFLGVGLGVDYAQMRLRGRFSLATGRQAFTSAAVTVGTTVYPAGTPLTTVVQAENAAGRTLVVPTGATVTGAFPTLQGATIDDDDWLLAYQGIAGLSWHATDRLDVDLIYRYMATSKGQFNVQSTGNIQPGAFSSEFADQSVSIGLRYS